MNRKLKTIFLSTLLLGSFGLGENSSAAVSLPFSTTYDCAEWDQGTALNCDGIVIAGGWTTYAENKGEEITSDANNPQGEGGRGQRHWLGPDHDGEHSNSGGLNIQFESGQTELWLRYYQRFQTGFYFNPYINGLKVIYYRNINLGGLNYVLLGYSTNGRLSYATQAGDSLQFYAIDNFGFGSIYPGNISDGSWHCYEYHIKPESLFDADDGIFEAWVDGIRRIYATNVDHGIAGGNFIGAILLGSNISGYPIGDPDRYIDYDDISIYNSTPPNVDANGNLFIGPLYWGEPKDATPPAIPSGLSVR